MVMILRWADHAGMRVFYAFDIRQAFFCGVYFWVGASLFAFKLDRYFNLVTLIAATLSLIILSHWPIYLRMSSWVLLPTIALTIGLSSRNIPLLTRITSKYDYSYGIYIYAFPIQQTIVSYYPDMNAFWYITLCTALTLCCAAFSWHFVECFALSLKPKKPRAKEIVTPMLLAREN